MRFLATVLVVLGGFARPALAFPHDAAHHLSTAVEVAGRVTDDAKLPVAGATVSLAEIGRATTTDADGHFRFTDVPAGRLTLTVRKLGFTASTRVITVATTNVDISVMLRASALQIQPVNVTATRAPIAALSTPLSTSMLMGDEVHAEGGISLAHAVAQLPGVRSISSGQQIGKPVVRGLFGPRVLVLADGSRIEDYSWSDEDAPSIDARLAQRIEVIRGPASVLYGSEALGGVVNVIPGELPFSADGSRIRRQGLEIYTGSNNIELGSAALVEGAQSKYGYRGLFTGRFAQNFHTPSGPLQNSSFWAFNGEAAAGMRSANGTTTIRGAHYGGEFHLLEASGPEAGDSQGGPVRQTLDDRVQLTNDYLARGMRFETKAQWQRHSLTEVSDDCQPVPPATTCVKVKDQKAFGLVLNTSSIDLLAHHNVGTVVTGTVGVSGMYQMSGTSGPIFLVPSATTSAGGVFAFEEAKFGAVSFVGGLRGDTRHLSSDSSAALAMPPAQRTWTDATADGGVVVRPVEHLALVANYGTGWRAPTLFDLFTNGPNVADARYEIGDTTLKSERARNLEGSVHWQSDRAHLAGTLFRNDVDRYIYNAPTSQSISGLRVFRHQQTNARLTGGEFSADVDVATPLSVRAAYDFVTGVDREQHTYPPNPTIPGASAQVQPAGTPLPFIPPPRAIIGANLHSSSLAWAQRAEIGLEVESHAKQTKLAPNDTPTNGYTLLNVDGAIEKLIRGQPIRFDLDVRNALNTSYTDFLSRYKGFATGPGVNVILKASTGMW